MAGSRNKKTYHFGAGHVGPTPALITFPPQLVVFWRDVPFALSWCGQVVAVVVEIVVGGDGWPMKGVVDIHTYLYGSSVRSGPNRGSASADFCLNREQNRTELSVRSDRFRFSGSVRNRTSATLMRMPLPLATDGNSTHHRPLPHSKRETEGFHDIDDPPTRVSSDRGEFNTPQTPPSLETRNGGFLRQQ
jgi:hypothetical protein